MTTITAKFQGKTETFNSVRDYAIAEAKACIILEMPHWMYVDYMQQFNIEGSIFDAYSYETSIPNLIDLGE